MVKKDVTIQPEMFDWHNLYYIIDIMLGFAAYRAIVQLFKATDSKANSDAEQSSNAILRQLLDDQKKKIESLEASHEENTKTLTLQEVRIAELERTVGDREDLITRALVIYFEAHPEAATKLSTIKKKGALAV